MQSTVKCDDHHSRASANPVVVITPSFPRKRESMIVGDSPPRHSLFSASVLRSKQSFAVSHPWSGGGSPVWRIWRRARLLAALAAFFLLVGVIGAPQLCLLLFRTRPAVAPAATRRKAVGRWQSWWGVLAYHFCTALGGMRVTMNCPPPTLLAREKGDFIVIAN